MALPPNLKAFREKLNDIGYAKRTSYQDGLFDELTKLDRVTLQKSLDESVFASATRMTSPGGDGCPCCGR